MNTTKNTIKPVKPQPKAAEILKHFSYDPDTGTFTRLTRGRGNTSIGNTRLCVSNGYELICLSGERHKAHRLAWIISYGEIPPGMEIDHINGNRSDNRIRNLRLASYTEQGRNRGLNRNNKSGVKGVRYVENYRGPGKWRGEMWVPDENGGRKLRSKHFRTLDGAASWVAEIRASVHGAFACQASSADLRPHYIHPSQGKSC